MNDYQIYLIAHERIDDLLAEAIAPRYGPGVWRRLAGLLRALADWVRIPGALQPASIDVTRLHARVRAYLVGCVRSTC